MNHIAKFDEQWESFKAAEDRSHFTTRQFRAMEIYKDSLADEQQVMTITNKYIYDRELFEVLYREYGVTDVAFNGRLTSDITFLSGLDKIGWKVAGFTEVNSFQTYGETLQDKYWVTEPAVLLHRDPSVPGLINVKGA